MNLESAQAEAFLRGIPYVDEMVFHRPLIFCMSPESVRASYNSQKLLKTLSLGNLLLNFQCIKNNFFNDSEHFAQLARVVSVPVGRHSDGRLATTLVTTINVIIYCQAQPSPSSSSAGWLSFS